MGLLAARDTPIMGVSGQISQTKKAVPAGIVVMSLKGGHLMRHVDFTPLNRSTVGFDRLFSMLDTLAQPESGQTYPPYNIERISENAYRITMAVAGFGEDDITIEARPNVLKIAAAQTPDEDGEKHEMLHRGIASRAFERRFQLADYVEVKGAKLKNGLLHIDLAREVPEAMKPRKIEITKGSADSTKQIEAKTTN